MTDQEAQADLDKMTDQEAQAELDKIAAENSRVGYLLKWDEKTPQERLAMIRDGKSHRVWPEIVPGKYHGSGWSGGKKL